MSTVIIEVVSDTIVNQSWEWALAADAISGDYWAEKRNQHNPIIRQKQLWKGKIGEFAVHQYLKTVDEETSLPELTAVRQTTHGADLVGINSENKYHVKLSIEYRTEGRSWVFEKVNPIIRNPKETDYICLCSLIESPNVVRIDFVGPASYFIGHYKPLIKKDLTTKCCIYGNDFPSIRCLDEKPEEIEFNPGF